MALIKYSGLVSDMRGKLNGSVMARNQYGNYIRDKVTPTNPATTYQQDARERFAAASQAWRNLEDEERQSWYAYAAGLNRRNRFGDSAPLSGFNQFVSTYCNATLLGDTPPTAAPSRQPCSSIASLSVDQFDTLPQLSFDVDPLTVPTGHAAVIWGVINLSTGINFGGTTLRLVLTLAESDPLDANFASDFVARFGSIIEGMRGIFRVALINRTSYQQSPPLQCSAIALGT